MGRRALIERIEHYPLADAFRIDGPTSAALAATLRLYDDAEKAKRSIPLLQLLSTSADNLKNRAERMAPQLAACDVVAAAEVTQGTAHLSGCESGSDELPTWRIEIEPAHTEGEAADVEKLAAALIDGEPGVVARIEGRRLVIDLRSVIPWQDIELITAFESLNAEEEEEG